MKKRSAFMAGILSFILVFGLALTGCDNGGGDNNSGNSGNSGDNSGNSGDNSGNSGNNGGTSVPSTPAGLSATAQSSSSISVSWLTASGATSYRVYRSTSSSGSYTQVGSPSTTAYTDTGLSASTTYYYKVSAYNSAGESSQSSYASAKTSSSGGGSDSGGGGGTTATKPSVPTGVKAAVQSSSSISVSWNSVSGATSYKIYRGVSSTWTPSETTAEGASYTFTGLDASTTYYFRITAINSAGESAQSTAVSAKTQDAPLTKPNTPYGSPTISNPSSTSLTVTWGTAMRATSYKLYRKSSINNAWNVVYSGASTTYKDTGVISNTTYWYRVTAVNSAGESDPSEERQFTTY
ncbi:MAG: fibronectin type III domain-containing protein [Treponema sp.]|jgi:fibronectin type 3 domain-containing protein|nr:fibronectin type III domain-containing protein [Treponema sp.]